MCSARRLHLLLALRRRRARPGCARAIFAETSTVSTQISAQVAQEADARGIDYLRLPISGNAASARTGNVTVLVSGPQAAWLRIKPVVESFSKAQGRRRA